MVCSSTIGLTKARLQCLCSKWFAIANAVSQAHGFIHINYSLLARRHVLWDHVWLSLVSYHGWYSTIVLYFIMLRRFSFVHFLASGVLLQIHWLSHDAYLVHGSRVLVIVPLRWFGHVYMHCGCGIDWSLGKGWPLIVLCNCSASTMLLILRLPVCMSWYMFELFLWGFRLYNLFAVKKVRLCFL